MMFPDDPRHPDNIHDDVLQSLKDYVEHGTEPGGFLQAVLANDLSKSIARADSHNMMSLPAIVVWLYEYVPSVCWGHPDRVSCWMRDSDGIRTRTIEARKVILMRR